MPKLAEQDLYAEAGQLLRHYLSWREKLLAGYVAIVAALALGVVKYDGFLKIVKPGLAAVGFLLTLIFWQLDRRNTELFDRCVDAGAALEDQSALVGPFTAIRRKSNTFTHRQVLGWWFGSSAVGMLTITILLWLWQ
jgi:hypothetical protein